MLQNATYLGTEQDIIGTAHYACKQCDYTTSHNGHWKRHLNTKKHIATQMLQNATHLGTKGTESDENKWCCDCGKTYNHHSSYYRHKATCTYQPHVDAEPQNQNVSTITPEHLVALLRENKELRELLTKQSSEVMGQIVNMAQTVADVAKVAGNNNTVSTNSHNTNINFYLNEHCKDAMSIQEFIKQLQIEIENNPSLLCAGKDTKPLLNVISNQLNTLAQKYRPLHSHKKTMYLKDEAAGWNPDKDGNAANTVIGAAKKAELSKLNKMFPKCLDNEKDGEKYIQSMSELTRDVTEKDKKEFEEMECLVIQIDE